MHRNLYLVLCVLCCVSAAVCVASDRPCTCIDNVFTCSNRSKSHILQEDVCPSAQKIDLSHNSFTSFPDGIETFLIVNIKNNQLTRLPTASQLHPSIIILNLEENRISNTSDELRTLSELKRLKVNSNNITSLNFLPETCKLENLDADNNAISSLEGALSRCQSLRSLGLQQNTVREIPAGVFQGMRELVYLDLNDNPLRTIASDTFSNLANLESLFLSNCGLTELPAGIFSGTPKLKTLHLSKNQLPSLPGRIFDGLHSLSELGAWRNSLSQLPVLHNCCSKLSRATFVLNSISTPSEEAVRSFLRGQGTVLILRNNGISPQALQWAIGAHDLHTTVDTNDCACGTVRGNGTSQFQFCVEMDCASYPSWIEAASSGTATT